MYTTVLKICEGIFFCEKNQGRLAKPYIVHERQNPKIADTYFGVSCVSKY